MALTVSQELEIISGAIGPDNNPLSELVYQSAVGEAINILNTAKDVDPELNPKADRYISKVGRVVTNIMRKDTATLDTLKKVLASLIGDSAFTYVQVSTATDAGWQTFIDDEILQCIEVVGTVTDIERIDYNGL